LPFELRPDLLRVLAERRHRAVAARFAVALRAKGETSAGAAQLRNAIRLKHSVAADREIGWVTTAASSPRLGPIALGYGAHFGLGAFTASRRAKKDQIKHKSYQPW
jgi:glycine cleavage system aminomethyltransferase T